MACSENLQVILAVAGVIIAIVVGAAQICLTKKMSKFESRQDERDERRRDAENYAIVTRFIQKYNRNGYESDIWLLPLCVVAYKYNPIYPYRREIYREFCGLSEEIQNAILEREGLDIRSIRVDNFYQTSLNRVTKIIEKYYPNDTNIFYDNGKYFERALKSHGTRVIPELKCAPDADELESRKSPAFAGFSHGESMLYSSHITNLLAWHRNEKPISKLFCESTSMGRPDMGDEVIISYLCCMIAKYAICYNVKPRDDFESGYVCDFSGQRYMEDLFLEALYEILTHTDEIIEEAQNNENPS